MQSEREENIPRVGTYHLNELLPVMNTGMYVSCLLMRMEQLHAGSAPDVLYESRIVLTLWKSTTE